MPGTRGAGGMVLVFWMVNWLPTAHNCAVEPPCEHQGGGVLGWAASIKKSRNAERKLRLAGLRGQKHEAQKSNKNKRFRAPTTGSQYLRDKLLGSHQTTKTVRTTTPMDLLVTLLMTCGDIFWWRALAHTVQRGKLRRRHGRGPQLRNRGTCRATI